MSETQSNRLRPSGISGTRCPAPIAWKVLDLLRNRLTAADLGKLSTVERQQFAEICHHWFLIAGGATGGAA